MSNIINNFLTYNGYRFFIKKNIPNMKIYEDGGCSFSDSYFYDTDSQLISFHDGINFEMAVDLDTTCIYLTNNCLNSFNLTNIINKFPNLDTLIVRGYRFTAEKSEAMLNNLIVLESQGNGSEMEWCKYVTRVKHMFFMSSHHEYYYYFHKIYNISIFPTYVHSITFNTDSNISEINGWDSSSTDFGETIYCNTKTDKIIYEKIPHYLITYTRKE